MQPSLLRGHTDPPVHTLHGSQKQYPRGPSASDVLLTLVLHSAVEHDIGLHIQSARLVARKDDCTHTIPVMHQSDTSEGVLAQVYITEQVPQQS